MSLLENFFVTSSDVVERRGLAQPVPNQQLIVV